jgi:ABC-2 type transport system ATP-binding protein
MVKPPDDVAIRIEGIHKDFHLPHHHDDSLKHRIITAFQKKDREVDTQHALRGITFDIKKGEFFGILGRNGSGKSTLLKIISEIYQPTSGSVTHRGKLVAFIELGVGFNPQLSGRENVYLNASLLGFSRKEIDAMYDDIVVFAELEEFMEQKLKNYSSGMKVRLAFAVAIQAHADILILDEVLAVGDADFQRKCYNYFKQLKQERKTIIFVSHSMGLVREYCDKAVLIEDGKITHTGTADEIADEYLKLFNKPQGDKKEAENRWGDQRVKIEKFQVDDNQEKININVTLKAAEEPIVGAKFGFRIKNAEGKVVAGANNLNVSGAQELNFIPKERKKLEFEMPNILGNGVHYFSATVNLPDGATTFDSWENITSISVSKEQVYYPILYPAKLVIKTLG